MVDGNNVIGSVPDGWWRDRPAAVRRLLGRLQAYQQRSGHTVVLVLDVPQRDLPEGHHDDVEVHYASRRGRNAADDRILELLDEWNELAGDTTGGGTAAAPVQVITSDRALAASATERGADIVGARKFLTHLTATGC